MLDKNFVELLKARFSYSATYFLRVIFGLVDINLCLFLWRDWCDLNSVCVAYFYYTINENVERINAVSN